MSPDLQRFQENLLEALEQGGEPAPAAPAPDDRVAEWVGGWDPDLVELAGVLVRTWALREPRR